MKKTFYAAVVLSDSSEDEFINFYTFDLQKAINDFYYESKRNLFVELRAFDFCDLVKYDSDYPDIVIDSIGYSCSCFDYDLICKNYENELSVSDISKSAKVSLSTVYKYAKILGYLPCSSAFKYLCSVGGRPVKYH